MAINEVNKQNTLTIAGRSTPTALWKMFDPKISHLMPRDNFNISSQCTLPKL